MTVDINTILNSKVNEVREDVPHPPGEYEFEYQGFELTETQNKLPMMSFKLRVIRVVNVPADVVTNYEKKRNHNMVGSDFVARQVRSAGQYGYLFDTFCLNFARRLGVADVETNSIADQVQAIVPGRRFQARLTETPNKTDPSRVYTNLDVASITVTQ